MPVLKADKLHTDPQHWQNNNRLLGHLTRSSPLFFAMTVMGNFAKISNRRRTFVSSINIIAYWSSKFGISPSSFNRSGIVIESTTLKKNEKIVNIFKTDSNCIVVLPSERYSELKNLISDITYCSDIRFEDIYNKFNDKIEKIIGPIYQGYKDNNSLYDDTEGKHIQEIDTKTYEFFNSELNNHDKMILDNFCKPYFALYAENSIVSLAHYLYWTDSVASMGILTHPKYRNQGYSKRILKLAINHAINNNYEIAYQTLDNNVNSKHLAKSVGIKKYATTLKVYLK